METFQPRNLEYQSFADVGLSEVIVSLVGRVYVNPTPPLPRLADLSTCVDMSVASRSSGPKKV